MPKRTHFVGISGIGMSGLARVLIESGFRVSGSDSHPSAITEELIEYYGAEIIYVQRADNVDSSCGLVVRSAAIADDHPEIVRAKELGIQITSYAELLGLVMLRKDAVCVSGTHGKTTTSSLIAHALTRSMFDPSYVIGGKLIDYKRNGKAGRGSVFVAEACEYKRSFLNYKPYVGVITNIDVDHLDYFRDLADIKSAFASFAANIREGGRLVVNADDANSKDVMDGAGCMVTTYGVENPADFRAIDLRNEQGYYSFLVTHRGRRLDRVKMGIPGRHNVSNALAAIAALSALKCDFDRVRRAFADFRGVERRFQVMGEVRDVTFIDDYAHHPREIRATLQTTRETFPTRRVWCLFQAHQHSRTRSLLESFQSCFEDADEVVIFPIYASRDSKQEIEECPTSVLYQSISSVHHKTRRVTSFDHAIEVLGKSLRPGDVVITLGAGDINTFHSLMLGARNTFLENI
ncbi:MAG: UDP-N-acetylmuramate--L-alanine ligase [Planctomycetes bacterium]|nr:UDP-N-acetylmuramate--L-alanine ligase [Planctomycetota bacterium]